EIHEHYLQSAHRNTSSLASQKTISGNFDKGNNFFVYNDSDKVIMQKIKDSFYQTEFINGIKKRSERFDIVIGSGRKAQTYLYYDGDQIHELPVSYFVSINSWANSPGLPLDHPYFDRNIPSGCFGCHGSAANVKLEQTGSLQVSEKYIAGQQLLGIDCERCHGPGMQHVNYQTNHPEDKTAKFITIIKALTRNQQMEMCALCHSGIKKSIQPVFSFKPGDKLDDYYFPSALNPSADKLDVHDTQAQTIMSSKCFQQSNTLTCITCHDTHQKERDNLPLFSQRCMTCHTEANHNFCKMANRIGNSIKTNCIDCHMPTKPSKVIRMLSNINGNQNLQSDYVRTHIVAVYPEESKKIIAEWKTKDN
ncbi:MAG: multiheme c-type cytochrome, partial [Ginsengibacter sp.]